jgi:hypothetical protein
MSVFWEGFLFGIGASWGLCFVVTMLLFWHSTISRKE